jgi:hypothetical protein
MLKAGFEPQITASERSKTVHASDSSATATGEMRITYRIFIGNPISKDHLGDLRLCDRSESNAEICLREILYGVLNWIGLN